MKEAMKAHIIDVRITGYPVTKSYNWIPVYRHPCDSTHIMLQVGVQRTNHDQEFCHKYD